MSVVSAYYYLRVVWYMYFREAPEGVAAGPAAEPQGELAPAGEPEPSQLGVIAAVSLSALGVLLVGIFPGFLLSSAEEAVRFILGG
jgi:NADH:ubiquinone oxidoreductase subunit 2 (subunit N)